MQRIELEDGAYLELYEQWLTTEEAAAYLALLREEIPWEARPIRIFGREVMQPRLVAYLGESDAVYTYSGVRNVPRPFGPHVAELRTRLLRELALSCNAVLCNLYRDGRDSMGMHCDAEPELGPEPEVASLSLGAIRRFQVRHRAPGRPKCDLDLGPGSLLVMRGTTQRYYRHGIPKQPHVHEPRINLTFRKIRAGLAGSIER